MDNQEQEAVRILKAFLQGSQDISEEEALARLPAVTPQAWARLEATKRVEAADSRARQRA
jgi:hypothetical protein